MRCPKSFSRLAILVLAAASPLLTACGSIPTVPIAEDARARIHVVSVNPVVKLPPDLTFLGQGQGAALMLGGPIVGALIANSTASVPKAQLTAEMQTHHILLGDIVAAEFSKQANAGSPMRFVVGTAPADAEVQLVVNAYGVAQAHGFGSTLYPLINLSAVMKSPDGTVLWQAMDIVGPLNRDNRDGHTFEDYVKDPELLRQAFVAGSDIVSHMLTQNLMGLEKPQNVPGIQQ